MTEKYLMIIGSMKCGTSSLYSYMECHPEICPAIYKEPEYFSKKQKHGIAVERYDDLWPDFNPGTHKYKMEASTGYTKYPLDKGVPESIKDKHISPKFIYIVRNPFKRIESHINFRRIRVENLEDDEHFQLIQTSKYYYQLEQYRKYFEKKDFLILEFEELISDPRKILEKTYRFLGITEGYYPERYEVVNPTMLESDMERKIRKSFIRAILGYIPIGIKNKIKYFIREKNPPQKRRLKSHEIEFLRQELKEDMERFSEEYGVDVKQWGF